MVSFTEKLGVNIRALGPLIIMIGQQLSFGIGNLIFQYVDLRVDGKLASKLIILVNLRVNPINYYYSSWFMISEREYL